MKDIIRKYLRSLEIKVLLNHKHIDDVVSIEIYDFISRDMYCSLLLAYSESELFVGNSGTANSWIGDKESNADIYLMIESNIRRFSTKAEWVEGKYDERILNAFKRKISLCLECNDFTGLECGLFKVDKVKFFVNPCRMYLVYYSYKGAPQLPIKVFVDSMSVIENPFIEKEAQKGFREFVDELPLNGVSVSALKRMEL